MACQAQTKETQLVSAGSNDAHKIMVNSPGPLFHLPRLPGVVDFSSHPLPAMKTCRNTGIEQKGF